MQIRPNARGRSDALDGLRALAALSVLGFHVWLYRDDRPHSTAQRGFVDRLFFEGNVGLLAFFVLSGYLLYGAFARASIGAGPRPALGAYAVRRAARILPAYYVCGAGCVLLYLACGPTTILPRAAELPRFAVFAQNYSLDTLMQLNPVLWTLAIEVAFYVALPVLALAGVALGPRRRGLHALLLVGLIAVTVGWYALDFTHDWGEIPRKTLPAYLGHFALGMLAALWVAHRDERGRTALDPRATAALMTLGWAVVAVQGYWHETAHGGQLSRALFATLTSATGFALIVAAAAAGTGRTVAWLRAPLLVRTGRISYGIYLWHLPLLLVLRENGLLPGALWPRLGVVLATTVVVASASWRWVERPAIAWAARRPARRRVLLTPAQHAVADTG